MLGVRSGSIDIAVSRDGDARRANQRTGRRSKQGGLYEFGATDVGGFIGGLGGLVRWHGGHR
jgi:hypothetical protein